MKTPSKSNLKVFETSEALHRAAAEFIIDTANKAIAARGRFTISLSGGQTPQKLYALLAEPPFRDKIDWKKTFIFWGDERCVPLNDERNNAYQAKLILLDKVAVPQSNIHRIPVYLSPAKAAVKYEMGIRNFFGEELPRFDLILLGMGEDGHTASLFPHTKVIDEQAGGVREVYVEQNKMFRITMTAPLINEARHILFLVEGKNKAVILKEVMNGDYQPIKYPAQSIQPVDGDLYVYTDTDATSLQQTNF